MPHWRSNTRLPDSSLNTVRDAMIELFEQERTEQQIQTPEPPGHSKYRDPEAPEI